MASAIGIIYVASRVRPFILGHIQFDQQAVRKTSALCAIGIDCSAIPELFQKVVEFVAADFVSASYG
jgi:hypothetical protein